MKNSIRESQGVSLLNRLSSCCKSPGIRRAGTVLLTKLFATLAVFALMAASTASAATYSWGVNGLGGTGNWATNSTNWWFNGAAVAWPNDTTDTAFFGNTSGTVTLTVSQSANALIFGSTGYVLNGSSTLTLGGAASGISYSGGSNNAIILCPLIDAAGISTPGTGTLTLGGSLSGAGALTQTGGTVNLGAANPGYTGAITTTTTGATAASLVLSAGSANFGSSSGVALVNTIAGGSTLSSGNGTTLNLTALTTAATLTPKVTLTTDPTTPGYNDTILAAPASGSALTLSGSFTSTGIGTAQIFNNGAGTVSITGGIAIGGGELAQFTNSLGTAGVINLAGNLTSSGTYSQLGGTLVVAGANSGFGGAFITSSSGANPAVLKVTSLTGLGNPSFSTVTLSNSASQGSSTNGGNGTELDLTALTTGGTISTPIVMAPDANNAQYRTSILVAPATGNSLTLAGSINVSGAGSDQFYNSGAGTLVINGNANANGQVGTFFVRSTGPTLVNGTLNLGGGQLAVTDNATLFINNPSNWGATTLSYGTIKLLGANVLPSNTTLTMGQASDSNSDTIDLGTANQSITGLVFSQGNGGVGATKTVTATVGPAILRIGSAGITMNPTVSGTLNLAGSVSVFTPLVTFPTTGSTTISSAATATLNLGGGTINAVAAGNNGLDTISATVIGNGGLTIAASGNLSDTGGGSGGYLALTGANTYTGTTTILSGLVNPGATDAGFGPASNLVVINNNGGLLNSGNATYSAARTIQLASGNGYFRTYSPYTMTVNSTITGGGLLNKTDGGTLVLTASNSYGAGTYLGAGTLVVSNTAGSATGPGVVTINNGTLSSGTGNAGIIAGAVVPGTGAMAITPGGNGTYGTLTVGGLSTNSNSTIAYDLTTPGGQGDLINVTGGNLSFGAQTLITLSGGGVSNDLAPGNYRLFQYNVGGTVVSTSGNATFSTLTRQQLLYQFHPDSTPGYLDVAVAASPAPISNSWNTGNGSWALDSNWATGAAPAVQGDTANLGLSLASTVTLDSQPHVGTLNVGPGPYLVSAGSANGALIMDNGGAAAIINGQGATTISAPITLLSPTTSVSVASGGTLLVSGAVGGSGGLAVQNGGGPLVLTANSTYSGLTSILAGGTLQLGNAGAIPTLATSSLANSGTLFLNSGAQTGATLANAITGPGSVFLLGSNPGTTPSQMTLSNTGNTFSGGLNIQGLRLAVTTAGYSYGSGTVAVSNNGQFWLNNGSTVTDSFSIAGPGTNETNGPYGALRIQSGTIAGNVYVSSASTITSQGGTGVITGIVSGAAGSPLTFGGGTTILTNTNNNYAGGTSFNAQNGTLISANPGSGGGAFGNGGVTLPAGPTLGLYADAGGSSIPGVAGTYNFPLTLTGTSANLAVGRTGGGNPYGSTMFTQAANQTVNYSFSTLTLSGQTISVANNNGYALDLTGNITLSGSNTFSVANATNSNVTQGLILGGVVGGGNAGGLGFTKAGAGTVVLANPGNTFAGNINITQGVVSIDGNGAAETDNNPIILNPSTGTSTLRVTGNLTLGNGIVKLGTASNTSAIEVTAGQVFNLGSLGLTAANATLTKNDNGTLVLGGVNSTWTGNVVVNAGVVQFASATALPTSGGSISVGNTNGAAVQLLGGITIPNPISLNTTGTNFPPGGVNGNGTFESVSGVNTLSGSITYNQDAGVGADAGATLNLTGGIPISVGHRLGLTGAGTINITGGSINSVYAIDKYGPGTTNIQVNVGSFNNAAGLNVDAGTLVFSGTGGRLTASGGNNNITVQSGATLTVNDSLSTAVLSRMNSNATTLDGGTFNYISNSTGSVETLGAFTYGGGGSTFGITNTGGGSLTLTMTSIAGGGGSTLNIVTSGTTLGTSTSELLISGSTSLSALTPSNTGIYSRVTVNGTSFATYGAGVGIIPFTAYNNSNNIDASLPTDTMNLSASPTWAQSYNRVTNAVLMGSGVALNGPTNGASLAPTTGNILVPSGNATIGSGTVLALAGVENGLLVNSGATLNIQGPITGTYNLTKGLGGMLVFSGPVYDTTTTNWLSVNGGTVQLNAGNSTLMPGILLAVSPSSELDLNGTAQVFATLMGGNNSGYLGSGGVITSSSGTGTIVVSGATSTTFPGQITGSVMVAKQGSSTTTLNNVETYTGPTIVAGGALTLQDSGSLTGTTSVGVNYATLTLSDNGNYFGALSRVGTTAPITLMGGVFNYSGRAQAATVQNVGAVTLAQGESFIYSTAGGTGINSADLILAGLAQTNDATVNFSTVGGNSGATGLLGSSNRVQIASQNVPLTNNIVGPWAITLRDFASYVPGLGFGPLNQTGFPGYSNTSASTSTWLPTDNVKFNITAGTTISMAANTTVNTLNVAYTANPTIDLGGNTLTVGNGTLSGGLMFETGTDGTVATLQNGMVTAGSTTSPADLYLYFLPYSRSSTSRTATIAAAIANNTAGGPVRLVYNGSDYTNNLLTLQGTNTYTGGTVVNAGMLVLGASGTLPSGGITINGSPANGGNTGLTQTLGGVIVPQAVTLNGAASLALAATSQSLTSLTINNVGGTTAPTVSGGTISLPGNGISATSNNVATVATISSALNFNNSAPAISVAPLTVNGQVAAPYVAGLNISGPIVNAGNLHVTGGGNLQLSGASTFTGGVTANSGGGLIIGASSTPSTVGSAVVSGPLGSGTLTISSGATILSSAGNTLANPVVVNGNFTFAGVNALTLNGPVTLPGSGSSSITIPAPQMTATLGGPISGGASITENGFGTLVLAGSNVFNGGVAVNGGQLQGSGAEPFGTGPVTINGGQLQLRANMGATYNNSLNLNSGLAAAFIDVNNAGASGGNVFTFSSLKESVGTVLNLTGGNSSKLAFNATSLTSSASAATFNVGSGLTLILPGGFNDSNRPANVGPGLLAFSGVNTFSAAANISGTTAIAAQANAVSQPLGSGAITLNNGATLQVTTLSNTLSASGYTQGGLNARLYSYNATTALNTGGLAQAPGATLATALPSDASNANHPPVILATQLQNGNAVYDGLLNITNAGVYSFQIAADDQCQFVIDGKSSQYFQQNGQNIQAPQSIYLSAGMHSIAVKAQNNGGGGGIQLVYSGPDTANNGLGGSGFQQLPIGALYYANNPYAPNNAAQINNAVSIPSTAAATLDAQGSDYDVTFASMSLGGTVTVNNQAPTTAMTGTGRVGIIGPTTISSATATISPNTGALNLIGGINDGGNGLTKTGNGALILGSNGGNFTGTFTIAAGGVQLTASDALSTGSNVISGTGGGYIDLNGVSTVPAAITINSVPSTTRTSATPAALYNSSPRPVNVTGTLSIGSAPNAATTAIGGYGDIVLSGVVQDGGAVGVAWNKVGMDTVTLAGANTYTGAVTVSNGYLALANPQALGTSVANATTVSSGASLDLNGQTISTNKTLNISGAGVTGLATPSALGALINSASGTAATYSGPVNLAAAASIGSPSLATGVGGDIVLSGQISGNVILSKVGGDNLNITGIDTSTSQLEVFGGNLTLSAGAFQSFGSTWNGAWPGASMTLDNSVAQVNNRMGGRGFINTGGSLTILSGPSSTLVTETCTAGGNNYNVGFNGNGEAVFTLDATLGGSISISVSDTAPNWISQQNQATALFRGTNLGLDPLGTNGAVTITTGGTVTSGTAASNGIVGQTATSGVNMLIYPYALADTSATGNGIGFLTYDALNYGVRPLNIGGGDGVYNTLTTNANVLITSALATNSGVSSINSLTIDGTFGPTLAINPGSAVTLQSGGLLALNGTSTISGGGALSVTNNAQLFVHTPNPDGGGATQLNIDMPIVNTSGGLTKSDGGTAVLGVPQLYTGSTVINYGTLQLAGGVNTIYAPLTTPPSPGNGPAVNSNAQPLQVNLGGTLDLNGNSQTVGNITNSSNLAGGIITNSSATPATLRVDVVSSSTFAGNITGNLSLQREGQIGSPNGLVLLAPNTYTGSTLILGANTELKDLGTIQNTSGITINRGVLTWDDTGLQAVSNRIDQVSPPPMTFNGGAFVWDPRSGTQANISLGHITFNSGSSLIQVNPNNGTATINMPIPTVNPGAVVTFGVANSTANGAFGDNPRVYFNNGAPTMTNGMLGGWALTYGIDNTFGTTDAMDFAMYDPTLGIKSINNNYSSVLAPGNNVSLTANTTLPAGGATINSLTVKGATTLTFAGSNDILNLQSGGFLANDNNARTIGAAVNQGMLTAGGTANSGTSILYLHTPNNSLTVNSRIVDNPNGSSVAVVLDSILNAETITIQGSNTYTGTTYVNGVNVNLNNTSGGVAIPGNLAIQGATSYGTDSAQPTAWSTVKLSASAQIASTANVSVNGSGILDLNSNNNTISNLTFTADGGNYGNYSPLVQTGTGVLTVSGSVNATNIVQAMTIPLMNGELNLTAVAPQINVDAVPNNPLGIGLAINSAITANSITKTGSGVLFLGGQNAYTGRTNVTQGGLAMGPAAFIGNSQVILAAGTSLNTLGNASTIGSLSGSGTVINYTTAAATLTTGWDNTNTTFSGTIVNPFVQGLLSLTKVGTGTMTLTADNTGGVSSGNLLVSPNLATLTVNGGGITLTGPGGVAFNTTTLNAGSRVTLDNSATQQNNRLGGSFESPSATVTNTTTARTVNFEGGSLTILGNTSLATTESLGTVNIGNNLGGGSVLTLTATNTAGVNLVLNSISGQNGYGTLLIRGDNLGSAAGANTATVAVNTAIGFPGAQGGGPVGSTTMSLRPDIIMDASSIGSGTGFAVYDTTTGSGLLRPLQSSEMVNSASMLSAASTTVNAGFTTPQYISANTSLNSLTLSGSGSINLPGATGTAFPPLSNQLAGLSITSGGVLASSGTTAISVSSVTSGGISMDIHVAGAITVLNLNSPIINTTNGIVKADAGTLVINTAQYYSGNQGLELNGGVVQLNGGNNTLPMLVTSTVPTVYTLGMNGGTLNLNGNSQAVGTLSSVNTTPGMGGAIVNTAAAAVNLFSVASAGTFGGTISDNASGPLSFYKAGGNTQTFTNVQTYQGSTTVQGGTLYLRDLAALTATSAVNVNYSSLTWDDTGLADVSNRLGNAPMNMSAAAFTLSGRMGNDTDNISAVNVVQGGSIVTLNLYNANQQTGYVNLSVGTLTQANGAIVNFAAPNVGTLGAVNDNAHIFVSSYNANSPLINGILGGWATVSGTDFAGYVPGQGIGALGTTGFPAYSTDLLTAGVPADNINMTASTTAGITTRTVNSLRINGTAALTADLNDNNQILTIGTGGLLVSDTAAVTIAGGQLTAGTAANTAGSLYHYQNTGTLTINSQIVNNGSGPVTLVHSGPGALTLTPLSVIPTSGTVASGVNSIAVANNSGLFVGEGVTGTNIPANTTITSINGNVLGLSAVTSGALAANALLTITPPQAGANLTVGQGTASLSETTFTPTVGMAVGGTGILPGTSITAVSGSVGNWTVTLSNQAQSSGSPVLTFGANSNTYTGGTIVNGIGGANAVLNLSGSAGSVVIPGNLTIQGNGVVTENVIPGQIAPTSNVFINGSGQLNLTGAGNVLNSLNFNDNGGTGTPTVAGGTGLVLSGSAAITSNNDNYGSTPTISGNGLIFNSSTPTISTSGQSPISLVISSSISSANGAIIKAGTGSVVFGSNASTFSNGVKLTGGSIILGASSVPTTGTVTSGPLGTGTLVVSNNSTLLSGAAAQTLANAVSVSANGNLNFGGTQPANNVTLSGPVSLGVNASLNVTNPLVTATITSPLNVTGFGNGLTKGGNGTLTLTAVTNNYTGPTNILGGTLQLLYGQSSTTISGFGDGVGWTGTGTTAPIFSADGTSVTLTSNLGSTARSVYYNTKQVTGPFTANFTYTASGNKAADGVTFVLQNSSSNALGATGGGLGYGGIAPSAAVAINIYPNQTVGTKYFTGGTVATPFVSTTATVNPASGDPIQVNLAYDGSNYLTETMTDLTTGGKYSTIYTVGSLASTTGGTTAYVGFTGGDGGAASTQTISNFQFTRYTGSLLPATTPLNISNGGALNMTNIAQTVSSLSSTDGRGSQVQLGFGTLTINGGNTTTFDGTISGGGGQVILAGGGQLTLTGSNTYTGPTTVNAGTLFAGLSNTLAPSSAMTVNGGTLDVTGGTQTVSSLVIGPAGTLNLNASRLLTSSGIASFYSGSVLNLSGAIPPAAETSMGQTIIAYNNLDLSNPAFTTVDYNGSPVPSSDLSYTYSGLVLQNFVVGPPTWISPISGNWSQGGNWNTSQVPNGAGQTAVFSGTSANAPVTVTLDVPQTVGTLMLGNSSGPSTSYTIGNSSNTLTLNNSGSQASVLVFGGTHTISAPVNLVGGNLDVAASNSSSLTISGNLSDDGLLRSVTLDGDGTAELVLGGSNSYGGGTYVDAGVLEVATVNSLPSGSNLYVGATASSFSPVVAGPSIVSVAAAGPETVPEPDTLVLLLAGLAAGFGLLRKRTKVCKV
jgi:autotransporter-associated beta strand protein